MKRYGYWLLVTGFLLLASPAAAQLTDQTAILNAVKAENPAAWACAHTDRPCAWDYIKLVACRLNPTGFGPWGLNGRRGDPKPEKMSWDALNYCGQGPASDPTKACGSPLTIIDVIGGAGGPNPVVIWQEFKTDPTPGAWIKPTGCSAAPAPTPQPPVVVVPPVVHKPYPGDAYFADKVGKLLEADYAEAGQTFNAGVAVWFSRTIWRYVNEGMSIEQSTAQTRKELRQALNLPPLP